ncbi:MAG: RNA polymerase sigma factor [Gammaproteobacteria bacterium]|nr:RNA polymerase sigma factor [Gammaproteobacteria bacterium]MDH4313416.1 RNA polymerase sigma factor [Gammaproteobacteria bacterium]MDH5214063.1 RNA polymerase sigma factor [Gammaproteobacteria bacterium]
MDDTFLVARVVAQQDAGAFGELVRRHQSQVRNFLRKLTRDVDAADDLAQEAFLHAWDRLHTYVGHGSFIGWLLKVAYTTFLQSKRKSKRYRDVLEQVAVEAGDPAHHSESSDISDLDKFLAVLTEEERAVMIMSYACGLSHREIGDATNQPVGTVKSIIFRGKQKIRDSFGIEDHKYG